MIIRVYLTYIVLYAFNNIFSTLLFAGQYLIYNTLNIIMFHCLQDSLYESLKNSVSSFRELVNAPDTPRWNSVLFGGLIGSLFSLLQFIASPVIGAASDVYGRKPLLILTMVCIDMERCKILLR